MFDALEFRGVKGRVGHILSSINPLQTRRDGRKLKRQNGRTRKMVELQRPYGQKSQDVLIWKRVRVKTDDGIDSSRANVKRQKRSLDKKAL